MPRYREFIDNADAIWLRTYAEQWRRAEEQLSRARDVMIKAERNLLDAKNLVSRFESEKQCASYNMATLIAKRVNRYIDGGDMVFVDEE